MTGHCTDCEEYDQKSHSCPKYCKVITETVKELKEESIPIDFIQKKIEDIRQYVREHGGEIDIEEFVDGLISKAVAYEALIEKWREKNGTDVD